MRKIYTLLTVLFLSTSLYAQDITGTWYGTLHISGTNLNLIFHIVKKGNDYNTTMDSPLQKAIGIPTAKTTFGNKTLTIEAPNMGLTYTGVLLPDSNKITGTFQQGGKSLPLNLSTTEEKLSFKTGPRPQDPKDFPYKQEEVAFSNPKGGHTLAGTLTMPANGKASKIVILITGSGPQDRNEEIKQFNHRPFLVLSDHLCRDGIAVLRYDDRGVGKSTGDFKTGTTADFADDAEAAVTYIQSRPDLKKLSIGLVGHSEGGMIAPMVASRNKSVKFIILLAGPGINIPQLYTQQLADQMKLGGASSETVQRAAATNLKVFMGMQQSKTLPLEKSIANIDSILRQELTLTKEATNKTKIDKIIKQTTDAYKGPWFRYFITFNPAEYLSKVKCPVLALNGTLDSQVECTSNLAGIKSSLQKAGNTHIETLPMEGLNHLLQKANTGAISEYSQIEETINPAVLQKVSTWINTL
nr:alpha/beta fold hydrolase [Pedobacter sp. ASV19]